MTLTQFLEPFFPDENEPIYIRTFKPKNALNGFCEPKTFPAMTRRQLQTDSGFQRQLKEANNRGGIYFAVNSGGNTDLNISRFNAFFVESDTLSIAEQHERLDRAPLLPSIRIETRKSVHAYWLIEGNCDEESWRCIQTLLIAFLDGDEKLKNPSRVMRLPFFNHVHYDKEKGITENKKIELHTFEPSRRFKVEQMWEAFPAIYSNVAASEPQFEKSSKLAFQSHEERHAELIRLIQAVGKRNQKGFVETRCPAHNGNSTTSLFMTMYGAVKCHKGCDYFQILAAFGLPTENLPKTVNAVNDFDGSDETIFEPFPEPDEKCFFGLAGDFVRLVEPHSEADKMALLIQFLNYFGVIIGRSAHFQVEANKHYTNTFVVLVGDTASGRKGTSLGRVKEVFKDIDEHFERGCIASGLSSGEGLIYNVRDTVERTRTKNGATETIVEDEGVLDKRLLVHEGEFAKVLGVQERIGNTLSECLRDFWDSGSARNMTKNSPLKTTNAHVGIVGHITKTELLKCLNAVESANGYANRFLWVVVERSKLLPFGGEVPQDEMNKLRQKLRDRISFAKMVERLQFTPDAAKRWCSVYIELETTRAGVLAKVTQRASPYVIRLSCIFALLDSKKEIHLEHLEAALAVWKYCENSARYIFGNSTGDKLADEVIALLRQNGAAGLTKTEITNSTGRNKSATRLNEALRMLSHQGFAKVLKEIKSDSRKPIERWYAKEFFPTRDEFNEFNEFNPQDKQSKSINSSNSLNSYSLEEIKDDGELF
ncbi:MAG TPA: DUF3987 domain-containing protein [Pyrinomonadaceae bacterium]